MREASKGQYYHASVEMSMGKGAEQSVPVLQGGQDQHPSSPMGGKSQTCTEKKDAEFITSCLFDYDWMSTKDELP